MTPAKSFLKQPFSDFSIQTLRKSTTLMTPLQRYDIEDNIAAAADFDDGDGDSD